ncbi:LOW QUALITY PROTEIN: hypothetical protein PHMEG_0003316 [Phytophthora megakarya]|uniref:RNase H type-1 domain-containing protein n=1 Tax=Phytophthora megakarya TaxID=4795 RepID=A0A225WZ08_9STRA|nr:LOW QUALITY PROTEIN: hypothetical protein PHMEG_0003316 [Phytophthora megakarya]
MVNVAEYLRMNNRVEAALELGVEDIVIVGDSRLAIQQFLEVIAYSLVVLLSRHKGVTAKFKSVKYLHGMREFKVAADSLATEALEAKSSKVVLTYSVEIKEAEMQVMEVLIRCVDGKMHQAYADFVQQNPHKTQKKRVRFADEQKKTSEESTMTDQHTEASEPSKDQTQSGAVQREMNAEAIDPVAVQAERQRGITTAQDEEVKWCNLKMVQRGDADKLKYRAALGGLKEISGSPLCKDKSVLTTSKYIETKALAENIVDRMVLQSTLTYQVVLKFLEDFYEALNKRDVVNFAERKKIFVRWIISDVVRRRDTHFGNAML